MRFDLHVHTQASIDSTMPLEDAICAAKKAGLSGIAVTNHNVFSPLPQVDDFILIPACEYTTDIGHVLTYFISSPLNEGLESDEKGCYPWQEIVARAREQDAVVIMAHPYCPDKPKPNGWQAHFDGIEGYNARIEHSASQKGANARARSDIRRLGCAFTAGSDAHAPSEVGAAFWEYIPEKGDLDEIKYAIRNRQGVIYGGRAKPIWRVASAWINLHRRRNWKPKPVIKLIIRTVVAAAKCVLPNKPAVFIDLNGKDE